MKYLFRRKKRQKIISQTKKVKMKQNENTWDLWNLDAEYQGMNTDNDDEFERLVEQLTILTERIRETMEEQDAPNNETELSVTGLIAQGCAREDCGPVF